MNIPIKNILKLFKILILKCMHIAYALNKITF